MNEQEIQYDIYYQGSASELYSLLYPLGGSNSAIFQHLSEQKVTYQPQTKQLTYTYSPDNFQNIDKQREQIRYTSKPVQNLSNYFYSTFHQDTGCFVWKSLNSFLQMRPENRLHHSAQNKQQPAPKRTAAQKTTKKQNTPEMLPQQATVLQLEVVESGQPANLAEKQINQAPITQVKPVWYCSKAEYFSYLAN